MLYALRVDQNYHLTLSSARSVAIRVPRAGKMRQNQSSLTAAGIALARAVEYDKPLAFVVNHSDVGSAIVFDYLYQGSLENAQKHNEIKNMRRYRFITGEGLTFGINDGEVEKILKARGFSQVKDVDVQYLKAVYFTGKKSDLKIAGGYGIVIGIV